MEKMKRLSIVWGFIMVGIFILLTTFGLMYKNKTNVYKELEKKLEEAEIKYVDKKFLYPQGNSRLKTYASELIELGLIDEVKIDDKECDGYVIVSRKNVAYDYKAYIKCENYETKGYEE